MDYQLQILLSYPAREYASDLRSKSPLASATAASVGVAAAALGSVATSVPQLDVEVTFSWDATNQAPLNTPLGVAVLHGAVTCVVRFTDATNGTFICGPNHVEDGNPGMAFQLKPSDHSVTVRVIADGTTIEGFAAHGRAQWVSSAHAGAGPGKSSVSLVADSSLKLSVDVAVWTLAFATVDERGLRGLDGREREHEKGKGMERVDLEPAPDVIARRVPGNRGLPLQNELAIGDSAAGTGMRGPVDPADWFKCRPGSGPCNPQPRWEPTYVMSESTSMQVCNFSGYQDPATVSKWGLVDFDWENARGDLTAHGGWAQARPMDCGDRMTKQVEMQLEAYPKSKSKYMIYRNFVKALPWLAVYVY